MLVSGKDGGPHVFARNALLHKMRAVAPNRKLVVSPGKLHLVKARTTHAGSKLGLGTFLDHDAALAVVVVAALPNILGETRCQLGGKTHAPTLQNSQDILCRFFMIFHEKKAPQDKHRRRLAASSSWNNFCIGVSFGDRKIIAIGLSTGRPIHNRSIDCCRTPRYHTTTPNGYNLQISYITHDKRLTLANAVKPKPTDGR